MGVRALVAAGVVVAVGAGVFLVDAWRQPGSPPSTHTVSQSAEMSSEPPSDPDVIVRFHEGITKEVVSDFFLEGVALLPSRTVHMDWENNRALLEWAPETNEELRRATVLVLQEAYPVAEVTRVR